MPDTHIKLPDVVPVVRYTANGTDTSFSYPFPIFASEDLVILLGGVTQTQGFTVNGAGETNGGSVTFDTAPASGVVVTLLRQVPYERFTDFLEGGDFSARALNNELDYLTASVQQLSRDQQAMLRYDAAEDPAQTSMPDRSVRANKALGFDAQGHPIPVDYGLTQATPNFTATGMGALSRLLSDKVGDAVSVRDFGAVGDGVADDTLAIGQALQAHDFIFIPSGTYRITNTIDVGFGKKILGAGQSSVMKADTQLFTAVSMRSGYAILSDFMIDGAAVGLSLSGLDAPCVQNRIENLVIQNAEKGIVLDGGNDTAKPCYWNIVKNCLVLSPADTGIHFIKSGAGDTPNANIFDGCRVYSNGANITGRGIYVEQGSFYNRFMNCEVNISGTAQACFTIGAGSNETVIDNLYTESNNGVPNLVLASGSQKTLVQNLLALSNGAAIDDQSGGEFQAINAGYPVPNRFDTVQISDLTSTLSRQDTVFIDEPSAATVNLTTERSVHLVSAFNGTITINLPLASTLPAATYLIKKIDQTSNQVIIADDAVGLGIDRKAEFILGGPYDYVALISNGAEWFITSSNRMAGNTQFHDMTGTLDIDMVVDTYLVSAFGGALTCRLPPANAIEAIGRTITIKKTDVSANVVTITEQGGNGPDQSSQTLTSRYDAITVVSNGAEWYIVSRF